MHQRVEGLVTLAFWIYSFNIRSVAGAIIIKMKDKFITPKSEIEIEMEKLLNESKDIVDFSHLTTEDAKKILEMGYKLLAKVEEVKKSRDNWRNKYETQNLTSDKEYEIQKSSELTSYPSQQDRKGKSISEEQNV